MAIELKQVSKRDGADHHIYETSLSLQPQGFNILLGTTLAGKTTLMRLMAGLEPPSSGEVWFDGRNATGVAVQKRNVSMVYQQFINYPNMSVFDNIASPLRVAGHSRRDIRSRVESVAELLQLGPMLKRKPAELSGGQQQRTALARALVKDSELVLLDEPLANLDYKLREELREELPKLFRDKGVTVVYATTEPTEALLLGGHTATLHAGRVTQFGVTGEVYRQPCDLTSAQVFSEPPMNLASASVNAGQVMLNGGVGWAAPQWLADQRDVTVAVRPHHLLPAAGGGLSVPIQGRVLVAEISGSESVIHLDIDGRTWVSQSHGIHPFATGSNVQVFIQSEHCLYFDADGNSLMPAGRGVN